MGKTLVLVRHAKSDWSVPGEKDFERTLNNRGFNDAPRIGRRLADLGVKPDLFLSSPAQRAVLTTELLTEQLFFDINRVQFDENIYEASLRTLGNIVNELDNQYNEVLIVGHNPGFTYFGEYLTKEELNNIPTCGAICISFDTDDWREVSGGTGSLKWFIYPKMLQ